MNYILKNIGAKNTLIHRIYNDMWDGFCAALTENRYELDPYVQKRNDTRRGVTALAYLNSNNSAVVEQVTDLLAQIKQVEPCQYYYPADELHLTVLSVISCIEGFQLSDIPAQEYEQIFLDTLSDIAPVEIEFRGITASPSCILIQGFPVGPGLIQLRDRLRNRYRASGLKSSFDSRYKLVTAHSTAIRFAAPLQNREMLMDKCRQYRNHFFGRIMLTDFELVFNDWYQRRSATVPLAKCSIAGKKCNGRQTDKSDSRNSVAK